MKPRILIGLFCFMVTLGAAAQQGSITVEKKGLKKLYLHDGEIIDKKQLASLLRSDPASEKKYNISKTYRIVGLSSIGCATVFAGVGLYYSIKAAGTTNDGNLKRTTEYSNKSTNNLLMCAGFMLLSIPFNILSNSNLKKSINLYNKPHSVQGAQKTGILVGITDYGVGILVSF